MERCRSRSDGQRCNERSSGRPTLLPYNAEDGVAAAQFQDEVRASTTGCVYSRREFIWEP